MDIIILNRVPRVFREWPLCKDLKQVSGERFQTEKKKKKTGAKALR